MFGNICVCTNICAAIHEKRDHERERGEVYGTVWRKEREGRNHARPMLSSRDLNEKGRDL